MKLLLKSTLVAGCVMALGASAAMAQRDGARDRVGRGGMGIGMGLGGLISIPEVQKELKLTEAEIAKVKTAMDEIQSLRPEGGFGAGQDSSDAEREKRITEFRTKLEEAQKKADGKIKEIVSADQWKRLSELRLQREGASSLNRAEVADELKLSDEQKAKVKKLAEELRPPMGRRPGGGQGGQPPNREEMQQRREKISADILAVLTPEQKKSWETMQGTKFTFPERGRGNAGGRPQRPAAE